MPKTIIWTSVAALLAACAPVEKAGFQAADLSEPVWALQTLQGERVPRALGQVATLKLNTDHSVSGTIACNSMGAGRLRWLGAPGEKQGTFDMGGHGAGIMTTGLCLDREAVTIASRFRDLLDRAQGWSIDRRGLVIRFADGSQAHLVAMRR